MVSEREFDCVHHVIATKASFLLIVLWFGRNPYLFIDWAPSSSVRTAGEEEEEGNGWGGDSWAIEWTRRQEDGTGGISLSAVIDVGTDGNRHGKGF
ncbi:hypothetical protein OPV22_015171 [Ensete ventricosum]|uniref:Uncharacterized protein n=1 Tax=Ensete ventricosum TaxID=4639 RepID=A0AAV8RCE2_ENSVE|nr:hypothetical protein OPV22_015171 [Ensete ventricosum]